MKKLKFLTAISLIAINYLSGQEITAPEPDFQGEIVFIDAVNNHKALEMVTTYAKTGQSVGRMLSGVGKVKARIIAKGKTSSSVIKKNDKLYFIYNNGSNDVLPSKVIQLLEFEQKKKHREYLVSSNSNVSGQTESGVLDLIPFKAKKYGNGSYLIIVSNLEPGEYAFFVGQVETYDGHFFTIIE